MNNTIKVKTRRLSDGLLQVYKVRVSDGKECGGAFNLYPRSDWKGRYYYNDRFTGLNFRTITEYKEWFANYHE